MLDTTYDILAKIGRIWLPAIATLYGTLAGIWGLPYGEAIVATIGAITVALNAILEGQSKKYYAADKSGAQEEYSTEETDEEEVG